MSDPLVHVGYFPKKIVATPEFLKAPQVIAVRSVSNCISPGPENWITQWKHNDLGLYDTIAAAVDVIPEGARPDYELHAYRILPTQWDEGRALPFEIPTLNPEPIPSDFIPLGFDVVSMEYSMFSCSPLSCNHMAAEIMTNQHCLLDDLETAKRIALQFSSGKVEPGPYLVAEVLARMKSAPHL